MEQLKEDRGDMILIVDREDKFDKNFFYRAEKFRKRKNI